MAYLGFLFEFNCEEIVVFAPRENLKNSVIVGMKSKMNLDKIDSFVFLNKSLSFEPFLRFDGSKFLYAKVCLSDETFLDFEHLTVWFDSKKYRLVRQLFEEEIESKDELRKRVLELYSFF